jgi:hypothetical protein
MAHSQVLLQIYKDRAALICGQNYPAKAGVLGATEEGASFEIDALRCAQHISYRAYLNS